jgi:hypothetical protein
MVNLFAESFADLEVNISTHSKENKKAFQADERFWKLSRDENDNGQAIIRLLPDATGAAYTKMFSHSFFKFNKKLNKKLWFIEDSPSVIKQPCPTSELWAELNSVGTDEAKDEAKTYSRKVQYITNILVVNDPINPENNGKVFLWKYGTKLQEKFISAMNPSEADINMGENPVPLYHALKGADIKLKIKKAAGGFLNYDDTTVMNPSNAFETREEAEDFLMNKTHKLGEFEAPEHFKTYEELKDKLDFVRGLKDGNTAKKEVAQNTPVMDTMDLGATATATTSAPVAETAVEVTEKPAPAKVDASVDEDMGFLDDL